MLRFLPATAILVFIFLFSLPSQLFAQSFSQEIRATTSAYVEVGGGAGFSLNLDQILYQQGINRVALRVGGGVYPQKVSGKTLIVPTLPLELLGMIGQDNRHFEYGLGYAHHFTEEAVEANSYFTGRLGFRYQKQKGGLLLRFAIIPLLYKDRTSTRPGMTLSPGFGLSAGKSF